EEFKDSLSVMIDRPRLELVLPDGVSIISALNKLRKISGKYVVRQVNQQDLIRFAFRLEFDPDKIDGNDLQIEAKLSDGDQFLKDCTLTLPIISYSEFVTSEENPLVAHVVQQFIASTTDEKMRDLVHDDVDEMKDMLEKQIGQMASLEEMLEDERAKDWDKELDRLGKEEVERRKAQALQMSQDLEELQAELADNRGLLAVVELIELMKNAGLKQEAYKLVKIWQKIMMRRKHRKGMYHKRHKSDDLGQKMFLEEALNIVDYVVSTQPQDPRFIVVREKIREHMERYN
ncbi:MAG: hypothetical protein AAFY41_05815, partial [Bacteroidota bacterium]